MNSFEEGDNSGLLTEFLVSWMFNDSLSASKSCNKFLVKNSMLFSGHVLCLLLRDLCPQEVDYAIFLMVSLGNNSSSKRKVGF